MSSFKAIIAEIQGVKETQNAHDQKIDDISAAAGQNKALNVAQFAESLSMNMRQNRSDAEAKRRDETSIDNWTHQKKHNRGAKASREELSGKMDQIMGMMGGGGAAGGGGGNASGGSIGGGGGGSKWSSRGWSMANRFDVDTQMALSLIHI